MLNITNNRFETYHKNRQIEDRIIIENEFWIMKPLEYLYNIISFFETFENNDPEKI